MKREHITAALFGTSLLATCGCGDETNNRIFSLPSDPPSTFIEAGFSPHQMQNWKSKHLTLRGDGAAALKTEKYQGEFEVHEYQLSEGELTALFDLVLQSGVMEHDPSRTKTADVHSLGKVGRDNWSRLVGPALTIHLLETNCPGRAPRSLVTATVRSPMMRGKIWNPGMEALGELGERLSVIQQKAERQGTRIMQLNE